jgi:hypothetical protein
MRHWQRFKTFKLRGEWVELLFMAAAAAHGYHILKPWGDSFAYDVGIEQRGSLLRVQVKSSAVRSGAGYMCEFRPCHHNKKDYSLGGVDLFVGYVIPENVWYLIPAAVLLGPKRKGGLTLCPVTGGRDDCKYEHYREAWGLLSKTSRELARSGKRR